MRYRLALAAALALVASALPAAAAEPLDLIKLPDDGNPKTQEDTSVYFYSPEGSRFVFPSGPTFLSWYADFRQVRVVSAAEMAALPLGGNATYKPGTRMIKIATDPKVYAISRGSRLRHVTSEAVAAALFGADWNRKIDDVSDAFFVDYSIGDPILSASDYDPAGERASVSSVADDVSYRARPEAPIGTPAPAPPPLAPVGGGKPGIAMNARVNGGVVVRGQSAVEFAAFDLSAKDGPVRLTSLRVQGYIDEQEGTAGYLPAADADNGSLTRVNDMVATLELVDEQGARVSGPVPVGADGRASFAGFAFDVAQDATRTLSLRGAVSKTVDIEGVENLLAFDVVDLASDLAAVDGLGAPAAFAGHAPNGGTSPKTFVTVRANGKAQMTWAGKSGIVVAGREEEIGILTIEAVEDDLELRALGIRSALIQTNASFGSLRLAYPGPDGQERIATAPFNGLTATFVNMAARVPKGTAVQMRLLAPILSKANGAKSGEKVELKIGKTDTLQIASLASGAVLDEADIGGPFVSLTETLGQLTVRFTSLTAERAADSPQGIIGRGSATDTLRFIVRTSPEGGARLRKLTFKLKPSDVANSGHDNDALESWADLNGDFSDDNSVINLYTGLPGSETLLGEGPEASIRYGIVRAEALDSTPQGLESAQGDEGRIEIAFNEGAEPSLPAGAATVFTLELDTNQIALGTVERTLEVELLGADAFQWIDTTSGFYEPLDGYLVPGLPVKSPLLIVR